MAAHTMIMDPHMSMNVREGRCHSLYKHRSRASMLFIVLFALLFILLLLLHPREAIQSSLRGISIWWDVLFPSLLPFFIISEALLGFGIVHFIGTLLDPVMRPLFRVPGVGGFVVAMGYASGYPVGAKLTSQLREQKLITRAEGERLVSFTTSSDPIFLIGAVSVGFFGHAGIALTLAAAHYGSGLLLGLFMRFHDSKAPATPISAKNRSPEGSLWSMLQQAFQAMHTARIQDGRPLGTLLRDAVQSSLKLMVVVGGLVVFFSFFMEMLTVTNIMNSWNAALSSLLSWLQLSPTLAEAFTGGLFEVTIGSKAAGTATTAGLHMQAVAAAWVLSWAGLSVHAQIASILNQTDLRYRPFLLARFLHSLLAAVLAYALFPWLAPKGEHLPTFLHLSSSSLLDSGWRHFGLFASSSLIILASILLLLLLLSFIIRMFRR